MKLQRLKKLGFSLIEVALALLVVSIGLVATIGMLPGGLDNSKRAGDDTQAALFADYVLNSLRALTSVTNSQVTRWRDVGGTSPKIPIAAPDMWDQGSSLTVDPGVGWKPMSFKPNENKDIVEVQIFYKLDIQSGDASVKRATLETRIQSSQNTNSAQIFYADLYRGDIPL